MCWIPAHLDICFCLLTVEDPAGCCLHGHALLMGKIILNVNVEQQDVLAGMMLALPVFDCRAGSRYKEPAVWELV